MDRTTWSRLDREDDLAEVLGVGGLIDIWTGGLQNMVRGTGQSHEALFSCMTQNDATVLRIAGSVMEHRTGEESRLPRIIAVGGGARFVGNHLRRDDYGSFCIEERHTVGDGGHMPMHKRNQTPRRDQHLFACRSLPQDFAVERPGLHVQPPVV